ncbi:MAG: VCBS repeat-containing protein [Saprospiraceae bacterium]|nr:VCBS repeat-containing protein [Saprospiraceae bacterium]
MTPFCHYKYLLKRKGGVGKKMSPQSFGCCFAICVLLSQCKPTNQNTDTLFQLLDADQTGIDFQNTITPTDSLNLLDFEYLYNGGGVGIGDFDNDGYPDLVFTGNMVESRIYRNKGKDGNGLQFEDITDKSGFDTKGKWCTGVSIVDINADGLEDIYISVGGPGKKSTYPNLLFVNQGSAIFKESAAAYGLADPNESNQAVFFDYDLDGDLDMYLLNGGGFEKSPVTIRPIIADGTSRNTDKLYQNNFNPALGHPVFTDVSKAAGITFEGFGLGVAAFDANQDGWPDLYVCNDYQSKDLLYVNQQNGTFREAAAEFFGHTSHFSMGCDVGDMDNDGNPDLLTLDMLPEDHQSRMTMYGPHLRDKFQQAVQYGYGHQYMRNMLHLGSPSGAGGLEIGQLAGVDRTDWSWCPLFADFDNDGLQDLFITNGYGKDITDLDFVKFRQDAISQFADPKAVRAALLKSLDDVPATVVPNFIFKNKGDLRFEKTTEQWGLSQPSISNGAAYADLDLDGDLEIITNNIDQKAFIYKNTLRERDSTAAHFLTLKLIGNEANKAGIGATVSVHIGNEKQQRNKQPTRGYQSTVTDLLHFGLGQNTTADSIVVNWPDGKRSVVQGVKADQPLTLDYKTALPYHFPKNETATLLHSNNHILYEHKEGVAADDFRNQPLLLHGFTNQGPCMAVGDVNGDQLEDIFIGGSYGSPASLFLQGKNGGFVAKQIPTEDYEDLGSSFFDADGDRDLDLYVTSGGSERYDGHKAYQDRLYFNDGKGNFTMKPEALPFMLTSTATVNVADFDQDGDLDLFVGGRVTPGKFPLAPRSYLLRNEGGRFTDVTESVCPKLENIGMVTAALWTDFDNDKRQDLIVVGEMMPITIFKNDHGKSLVIPEGNLIPQSNGMWNSIAEGDLDNDGDMDYVLGNIGENTPFKSSPEHPMQLHYADFDKNGSMDPIFSVYEEGKYYPFASLDVLAQQLPILKKKYLKYAAFAKATTDDLLQQLGASQTQTLTCEQQSSSILENLGNGKFALKPLPRMAQIAPVKGILTEDLNADGLLDLLLVGNEYDTEVVSGRFDASHGTVLLNEGKLAFKVLPANVSGLYVSGDARGVVKLKIGKSQKLILVAKNSGKLESFGLNHGATSF